MGYPIEISAQDLANAGAWQALVDYFGNKYGEVHSYTQSEIIQESGLQHDYVLWLHERFMLDSAFETTWNILGYLVYSGVTHTNMYRGKRVYLGASSLGTLHDGIIICAGTTTCSFMIGGEAQFRKTSTLLSQTGGKAEFYNTAHVDDFYGHSAVFFDSSTCGEMYNGFATFKDQSVCQSYLGGVAAFSDQSTVTAATLPNNHTQTNGLWTILT